MTRLAVLIWLLLAPSGFAQTIVVKSGDHAGFTRLVVELPKAADWRLGRSDDGYALLISGAPPKFDLTQVFQSIGRGRLAAIWADPASGALRLGIACACHALPFEFRPGVIVIDLRDGPPPKGSSFELALDGSAETDLRPRRALRPQTRPQQSQAKNAPTITNAPGYDWLSAAQPSAAPPILAPQLEIAATFNDLTPLKSALLSEMSRGAAQGLVQMAMPSLGAQHDGQLPPTGPRANIHLGEVPGFTAATRRGPDHVLLNAGQACIEDTRLNIRDWGNELPVPLQIADSRAGLMGEFDKPDPEKVIKAAKLLINIGFGAEARQLLAQMPVDAPDRDLLLGLAALVDGAADPAGPFTGMQSCDTSAALWATLAMPNLAPSDKPQTPAVLRAFSALPAHLRQALGPGLAEKFMAIGDTTTARSISNSAQRGISNPDPEMAVMDANLHLAEGNPAAAARRLEPVLPEAGPATADVLIALVDASLATNEPLDAATATALAALVNEQRGSAAEPALRRAHLLALGLSGAFDQAFELLPTSPAAGAELWQVLARSGAQSAILSHAVLSAAAPLPDVPAAVRSQIAEDLFTLGLADAALRWIGPPTDGMPVNDRLLAANAALQSDKPSDSLAWLTGLEDSAPDLRARTLLALDEPANAAKVWASAGNLDAEHQAQAWASDWAALSKADASPWQAAAALISPDESAAAVPKTGPLAQATKLVAQSAAARTILDQLLATVPDPAAVD